MKGIGVSKGIAIGKVHIYKEVDINITKKQIQDIDDEIGRFHKSANKACQEIDELYEKALKDIGETESQIFVAHRMMLEDPEFISAVEKRITNERINSEFAIREVVDYYVSLFESIEDENFRLRALDLKDVSKRLLMALMNIEYKDLTDIEVGTIIVAEDLSPSDTTRMNKANVIGIVTELGGKTSHTSIIARTLGIPAIVGVKDIISQLISGDELIINGETGDIIISPSEKDISENQTIITKQSQDLESLNSLKGRASISKDGFKVELGGNIGNLNDIQNVLENDGEGVGLFRTEFLYMDRDNLPTEQEQFEAYRAAAKTLGNKSLVIRTLDVGGDKDIEYLKLPKEMNPFLGNRAIRLCLNRLDIFKAQLRAILRASAFGNIKIMFPMISNIDEVRECKSILEDLKNELRLEEIKFNNDIEVGIMVEIPSVALNSRIFAREVGFFSIGTNDLIQYTLAVDRGNQNIVHLYNQYDPSVLKLIKMTIENGHKEGIWVGMCGEAAGDKKMIPILLAMGLDEFSMSPDSILKARHLISKLSKKTIVEKIDDLLELESADEVEKFIDENILNSL